MYTYKEFSSKGKRVLDRLEFEEGEGLVFLVDLREFNPKLEPLMRGWGRCVDEARAAGHRFLAAGGIACGEVLSSGSERDLESAAVHFGRACQQLDEWGVKTGKGFRVHYLVNEALGRRLMAARQARAGARAGGRMSGSSARRP